jgi:hypothetical protein
VNVFEHNAAQLEKLRERVYETLKHRSEGPEGIAAWQNATRAFHAAYDELAFPGGLEREFVLLEKGEPEAIEMAVRFLEANPWYFRSGYHKENILKLLRRYPLSEDQCERLRKVILDRVRGRPVREMRAYARLAPKVSSLEFEVEMRNIAEDSNRHAARHAKWVLECMKVQRPA